MHSAASMRSIVRCSLIVLLASAAACNNYDLLDHLENPGGKETFTDRLYFFVTSQMTPGDMTGLNAGGCGGSGAGRADCVCEALAKQNNLRRSASSKYLAWLSTSIASMNCRFIGATGVTCAPTGPSVWYNTNNEIVFTGVESATTGLFGGTPSLPAAPKFMENRQSVPNSPNNVWTGTNPGGANGPPSCNDWSTGLTGTMGRAGTSDNQDSFFTNSSDKNCDIGSRVYCVALP